MSDKRNPREENDPQNEGRKDLYVDVDRMINEGLAGGTVNPKYDHPSIEDAIELPEESPPKDSK